MNMGVWQTDRWLPKFSFLVKICCKKRSYEIWEANAPWSVIGYAHGRRLARWVNFSPHESYQGVPGEAAGETFWYF